MFIRSQSCFLRYAAAIRDHSSGFIGGRGLARSEPPGRRTDSIGTPAGERNFKINYSAAPPKHGGISNCVAMVSFGIISPRHHVGKRCFPVCLSYLMFFFFLLLLRRYVKLSTPHISLPEAHRD